MHFGTNWMTSVVVVLFCRFHYKWLLLVLWLWCCNMCVWADCCQLTVKSKDIHEKRVTIGSLFVGFGFFVVDVWLFFTRFRLQVRIYGVSRRWKIHSLIN